MPKIVAIHELTTEQQQKIKAIAPLQLGNAFACFLSSCLQLAVTCLKVSILLARMHQS